MAAKHSQQSPVETYFDRPLPENVEAERLVLGGIMTDEEAYVKVAAIVSVDDFSLEKHKRIFLRISELAERGEVIDYLTVHNELSKHGQVHSVDGLSYLVSLSDGLPKISNIEGYARIVKEKSQLRKIINVAQDSINRCLSGEGDSTQIIGATEDGLLKLGESGRKSTLLTPIQILDNYEGGPNAFLDTSRRVKGLETGLLKFDEMTGGLRQGELILIAARPAMGKSALSLGIAHHVASHRTNPKSVAVFSLEMSNESLLTRLVCAQARVDQWRFRAGYLSPEEREALQYALYDISRLPLHFDDSSASGLVEVHSKLRRLQAEEDLGLVVIDYLQLMSGKGKQENRQQEVSGLSRGLKLMSKELKVPFLVLSQLSRGPETRAGDHRPMLSDLRESGCLTGDTLVTEATTGHRIPIRDFKKGMKVWSLNEQTLKIETALVSRAFSSGTQPVFLLKTQLGRFIRATANHPFRAWAGWKPLSQFSPNERLALPRTVPDPLIPKNSMSASKLALLGHLIGNGCMLARHCVQYTSGYEEISQIVATLAKEAFGNDVEPRVEHDRNWYHAYLKSTRKHKQNVSRERALRVAAAVKCTIIERLATSDIYWDQVESIEPAGEEEVFDLTVPGHHNFIANDIFAHNSLEQDSDVVGFVFREEVYRPDKEALRGVAELILAKQREGPTGRIKLAFLKQFTKFENLVEGVEDSAPYE